MNKRKNKRSTNLGVHKRPRAIWEVIFGFGWLLILFLGDVFIGENSQAPLTIIFAVAFFWLGLLGVIFVLRKEAHLTIVIQGKPAIIIGCILTCGSWSISLWAVYILVRELNVFPY